MRTLIILAVLFASLLMVAGAALAKTCCVDQCYNVTGTDLNDSNSFTQVWTICWGSGEVCINGALLFQVSFFNQGLIDQAVSFTGSPRQAYMRFHGDDNDIFNGLYYDGTNQFSIHGVAEECP